MNAGQDKGAFRVALEGRQRLAGPNQLAPWPLVAARIALQGVPQGDLWERLLRSVERQVLPFAVHPLWPPGEPTRPAVAERLAAFSLALQRAVGLDLWKRGCLALPDGRFLVHLETLAPELSESALELACDLAAIASAPEPKTEALDTAVVEALRRLRAERPPRVALLPLRQIHRSGLPWRRLANPPASLELGYGAAARRVRITLPDDQEVSGYRLCGDKTTTLELLRAAGIPVPESQPAPSFEAAAAFARRIGYPVVLKPREGSLAKGVVVNLRSEAELRQAWEARPPRERMVVERFVRGFPHRLLVMDGRLVHAVRRFGPEVVGDGEATVSALIERMSAEPQRNTNDDMALESFDPAEDPHSFRCALEVQGLTPQSVPAAGQSVWLGYVPLHRFKSTRDVMDRMHPAVATLAETVADVLDMKTAGIDYLTPDISEPPERQGSAINEVNAAPWLSVHVQATPSLNLTEPLLRRRLGAAEGRIPLCALADDAPEGLARLVLSWLRRAGRPFAFAAAEGAWLADGRKLPKLNALLPAAQLLRDRRVAAALISLDRRAFLAHGLPFDLCDVGVLGPAPAGTAGPMALALANASRRALVAPAALIERLGDARQGPPRLLAVCEPGEPATAGASRLELRERAVVLSEAASVPLAFPLPSGCPPTLAPWLVAVLLGLGFSPPALVALLAEETSPEN